MNVGDVTSISGCFTKEKFIAGRTLVEIERILGFGTGRLANGMIVAALLELPSMDEFDLAAYSNVPTHKFRMPTDLDIDKLKALARESWALAGFERLVKVLSNTRHDPAMAPDLQYPPGKGAPQWIARRLLSARVDAIVTGYPNARYVAVGALGHG